MKLHGRYNSMCWFPMRNAPQAAIVPQMAGASVCLASTNSTDMQYMNCCCGTHGSHNGQQMQLWQHSQH